MSELQIRHVEFQLTPAMGADMVAFNPNVETEREEAGIPRPTMEGVYFTRFDIYESESEWIFRCRMPDTQLVQVDCGMKNGELVIRGKVRFLLGAIVPEADSRPLCFFRSFPISGEVKVDRISTNFREGVLTVRLPKASAKAPNS